MSQKVLKIGDLVGVDGYTREFYFKRPKIEESHPGVVLLSDSNRLYIYTLGVIVILTPLGDRMRVELEEWGAIGSGDRYVYFYNSDYEKVKDIALTIDEYHNPRLLDEIRERLGK